MTTYPPPKVPFISARYHGGEQTPKAIVIHATVSSDNPGTARAIANWWHGSTSPKTSAHYIVDPKETIQCVGDHTVAYHCGSNQNCIGVELCDEQSGSGSRWADADSKAILARGARLVAQLCLAYGIAPRRPSIADLKAKGKHGIYGHNDSRLAFGNTSHTDPGLDFPWSGFIDQVQAEIFKIKGGNVSEQKPTATQPPAEHQRVMDDWTAHRLVDINHLSAVEGTEREPWASAAYRFHHGVNELRAQYLKDTGEV